MRETLTIEEITKIEKQIGYTFKHKGLLIQAFTRSSFGHEKGVPHNETLEWVGDSAIGSLFSKNIISEYFGISNSDDEMNCRFVRQKEIDLIYNSEEQFLSSCKSQFVYGENMARAIDRWGIVEYLIMSEGDCKNRVYETVSVKEDLFEAICGAITIDSNWDDKSMYLMEQALVQAAEYESRIDACENIPAVLEKWFNEKPKYWFNGNKCKLEIITNYGEVFTFESSNGLSKEESKGECVLEALYYFSNKKNGFVQSVKEFCKKANLENSINVLQEMFQSNLFSKPEYEFEEKFDINGNPIWICQCFVIIFKKKICTISNELSSKKEAKKEAAFNMIQKICSSKFEMDLYNNEGDFK